MIPGGGAPGAWWTEARATLGVAAPLIGVLLVQMAMGVTDTVLLGRLGGHALAAGGLGGTVATTLAVVLQGGLAGVSILVAQARGAGQGALVPAVYGSGLVLTAGLSLVGMAVLSGVGPLLRLIGEDPALVRDAAAFTDVMRWSMPGSMVGAGLMRAFLPAVGRGRWLLPVSVVEVAANGVLSFGLIHGAWGLPALGLVGAAAGTTVATTGSAVALLVLVHRGRGTVARLCWDGAVLRTLLLLGVPVAATFAVEAGLFVAVSLLMGLLGPAALAAHQVAFNAVGLAFMVPLGLSQAANVRVAGWVGAGDAAAARRAGLVALGLCAGFELLSAAAIAGGADGIAGSVLGERGGAARGIAVGLLQVAAVFQMADGVQCVAAGALRGLGDTRVPFVLAAAGYWGAGFPLAWWLGLHGGAGPSGAWWGLAAGLGVVAVMLLWRFAVRSRNSVASLTCLLPPAITPS